MASLTPYRDQVPSEEAVTWVQATGGSGVVSGVAWNGGEVATRERRWCQAPV